MSNSPNGVVLTLKIETARSIFHSLYEINNLTVEMLSLFYAIAETIEESDLNGAEAPMTLPVRYWHPDSQKSHYELHTVKNIDCTNNCHPNDRAQCEVCQNYTLLLAFQGNNDPTSEAT